MFNIKENPFTHTRNYYNKQMDAFDSLQKRTDAAASTTYAFTQINHNIRFRFVSQFISNTGIKYSINVLYAVGQCALAFRLTSAIMKLT